MVLLVVFLAGPILYCIYAAFTNMALTGQVGTQFVGFDNFTRAFSDPAFCNSVWLTLVFTVGLGDHRPERAGHGAGAADAVGLRASRER